MTWLLQTALCEVCCSGQEDLTGFPVFPVFEQNDWDNQGWGPRCFVFLLSQLPEALYAGPRSQATAVPFKREEADCPELSVNCQHKHGQVIDPSASVPQCLGLGLRGTTRPK